MTYENLVADVAVAAQGRGAHYATTLKPGERLPDPPWAEERDFWIGALGENLVALMDKMYTLGWKNGK